MQAQTPLVLAQEDWGRCHNERAVTVTDEGITDEAILETVWRDHHPRYEC
jgi:hypothetical protein